MPCSRLLASVRHGNFARAALSLIEIQIVQRCRNPFTDTSPPAHEREQSSGKWTAKFF